MSVLGTAEVIIRAITTAFNKDIKEGLDKAAKDVDAESSKQGEAFAAHFGDEAEAELEKGFGDKVSNAVNKSYGKKSESDGDKLAKGLVKGFTGALTSSLGAVGSLAGLSATVVGLGGGIGALVGLLGDLAGGLVAVSAAAAPAVAALGVGLVSGIGALVQGAGVGVLIFKQLGDEAKQGSAAAVAAQSALKGFGDKFKGLAGDVGNSTVFPALSRILNTLSKDDWPLLSGAVKSTGAAIASVIDDFNNLVKNPLFKGNLSTIFSTNSTSITRMGGAFASLTGALATVVAAASPMIDRFTAFFQGWATKVSNVTTLSAASGRLGDFFQKAGDTAAQLGGILSNLWGTLKQVASAAAPLGATILGNWAVAAKALNDYVHSADGLKTVQDFFAPGGPLATNLQSVKGLVGELAKGILTLGSNTGIADIVGAIKSLLPPVVTIVDSAVTALGAFGKAISAAADTSSFKSGVKTAADGIASLGAAAGQLAPLLGPLLSIIGNLASQLSGLLGPAFKQIADIAPQLVGPMKDIGQAIGTVLAAALNAVIPLIPGLARTVAELATAFSGPLASAVSAAGGVLSAIASVLSVLAPIVSALAPEITALVTAFLLFKGISAISDTLGGFSKKLQDVGANAGVMATQLGASEGAGTKVMSAFDGVSGAAGKIASSLPLVGAAVGVVTGVFQLGKGIVDAHKAALEADTQAVLDNYNAVEQGGKKGQDALTNLTQQQQKLDALKATIDSLSGTQAVNYGYVQKMNQSYKEQQGVVDAARKTFDEQQASMTTAEKDTQNVTKAQADYAYAVQQSGINSYAAQGASVILSAALQQQKTDTDLVSAATQTEIDKLQAHTAAALGASNATVAASQAQQALSKAITDYKTQADAGKLSGDALTTANNNFYNSAISGAQAAANQAASQAKAAGVTDTQTISDKALYDSLVKTQGQIGKGTIPALDGLIGTLGASGGVADEVASQMNNLGLKVTAIPNSKDVKINAPTAAQEAALQGLGYTVTHLPDGTVTVSANGIPSAEAALNNLARNRTSTITVTTVARTIQQNAGGSTLTVGGSAGRNASGGLVNSDMWSTVGEEGRELVFLTRGSYVATYQKAQKILQAATLQARGLAGAASGASTSISAVAGPSGGAGLVVPITVNPAPGMNESALATATSREFARQYRRLS